MWTVECLKRTRCAQFRLIICAIATALLAGCKSHDSAPRYDRPFPLGQVTDAFWETQQTNAEAADFILYQHEFVKDTTQLAPGAKRHLEQIALRLEQVPFPVVIEQSEHNARPELDQARQRVVIENLIRMGVSNVETRVVVASAFAEGFTSFEGQAAYYGIFNNNNAGGRFNGGQGGARGRF